MIIAIIFLKKTKDFESKEAINSTLITSIVIIIIGSYFLIIGLLVALQNPFNPSAAMNLPLVPPFSVIVLVFIPILIYFFGAYAIKESFEKKYEPIEAQIKIINQSTLNPLDLEIARKLFHTIIDGVLICYLFIGDFVSEATYSSATAMGTTHGYTIPFFFISSLIWGKRPYIIPNAGQIITIFAIFLVFILISFSDLVRIYKFRYYPIKMVSNIYREKERYVFGPHVYLAAGGLFVVVFFPPQIAMVTIAIAALGDAFATIIGVGFGKHKIHGGKSNKTREGCIAGFLASFGFSLLMYFILMPKFGGKILQGITICLLGAITFLIVDYYSPRPLKASDNILNPVLCSIITYSVSLLF